MTLWGKLAGAAAGLAVGGPIGALVGGLAGHYAVDRRRDGAMVDADQITFTVGVIALGAKMAKADGRVTSEEVAAFRQVFRVPEGDAAQVGRLFNLAKQDVAGYEEYAQQLADLLRSNRPLLEDLLDALFYIATADGSLHEDEDIFLKRCAKRFGFSKDEYRSIRARYLPEDVRNPYRILGVPPDISDADLRAHYRQLVRDHHPDQAMARGMPAEFVRVANEKLAVINAAYEAIRKERGL